MAQVDGHFFFRDADHLRQFPGGSFRFAQMRKYLLPNGFWKIRFAVGIGLHISKIPERGYQLFEGSVCFYFNIAVAMSKQPNPSAIYRTPVSSRTEYHIPWDSVKACVSEHFRKALFFFDKA